MFVLTNLNVVIDVGKFYVYISSLLRCLLFWGDVAGSL
jgi:hypothetical protein